MSDDTVNSSGRPEVAPTGGASADAVTPGAVTLGGADVPVAALRPATSTAGSRPRLMPADYRIAVRPGSGSDTLRSRRTRGERRQPMQGFDDTYVDVVDFIVRITHRIWEDQDVGYIYDTYSGGCAVHDDSGPQYGVERVVESTIAAIHAFPDTRSWADEVIWAGDDQQGFVTSHRYITTGHHLAPWRWGAPTGRKVNVWGIANCVIRENEIVEEWVLYNMTSRFMQLGIDVSSAAREYGNELNRTRADRHRGEVDRLIGGRQPEYYPDSPSRLGIPDRGSPEGRGFDVDHFIRAVWHNLYNRRDLSTVDKAYTSTVRWTGTSNRLGYGRQDVKTMARALLATFPDLGMAVDEVYWMGNDAEGYRVSVRWTARGTHRGYGLYGQPTDRRVHLWGIDQLYITDNHITDAWSCFNEFDVLAQILSDEPAGMVT